MASVRNEIEVAARTLGLQLQLVPAVSPDDFVGAFAEITREHAEAVIVMPSPMLFGEYGRIASILAKSRLPAMGAAREFADLGGLMSYGANQLDLGRQSATYADKILRGAKPAELPVEQPTKFELVLNLKTAKALDLTIPSKLLARADEVIE
jgi:putative ABC transport system substrate-binding protein